MNLALLVALSVAGVAGDACLKHASNQLRPFASGWFAMGVCIFAGTAFGWVVVLADMKLATVGAAFAAITAVLLTVVGVVGFGETLSLKEIVGLTLAVASVFLLGRHG